ncbi:hypothetical protein CS022_00530 [Veronia nyctiphanis]|uniref:Bacterial virulence factor lipase N-terminal domain-containing protein n=1 Tax=Veronia nyctiphanis TaxID=1278244 RepID=A0A4Q0YWU1_9GAMM|nr:hypothetical protein [Veronia nyctiphanis]RXJ74754.1 hypothetical protein CS022_00530 [Veronia nyctiphanis]
MFIQPLELLEPKSEYIYVVTDAIRDMDGISVGTSRAYATLATGTVPALGDRLNRASRITIAINKLLDEFSDQTFDINSDDIIFSSWFSTQSITDDLVATKYAILTAMEQGGLETLWKGKANPNNVDLSGAYQMNFSATTDFGDYLRTDENFDKYVASQAGGDAPVEGQPSELKKLLLDIYGAMGLINDLDFINLLRGIRVDVTSGTVNLPHFLYKDENWRALPAAPAAPNVYTLSYILKEGTAQDQAAINAQLRQINVDPLLIKSLDILNRNEEMVKLIGADLRLADGNPITKLLIDAGTQPSTIARITRYSPFPTVRSMEEVPFLLVTPKTIDSSKPLNLLIYNHAVIASKETVLALVPRMIGLSKLPAFVSDLINLFQPLIDILGDAFGVGDLTELSWLRGDTINTAILVIDLPLHGERSLDEKRSANTDPTAYIALQNMAVGKSIFHQSIYDTLGLRLAVDLAQSSGRLAGTPLENLSDNAPGFMAHSLGGISGLSAVAIAQHDDGTGIDHSQLAFSSVALAKVSAGISDTLLNSSAFELTVKHFISEAQSPDYRDYIKENSNACDPAISSDIGKCYTDFVSAAQNSSDKATVLEFLEQQFKLFSFAAQMMLDGIDPYSFVDLENADGTKALGSIPILAFQAENDEYLSNEVQFSPFSGTEPLARRLGLNFVSKEAPMLVGDRNLILFNDDAVHTTFLGPTNVDEDTNESLDFQHNNYIQVLINEFFQSQGQSVGVFSDDLLETSVK